MIAEKILGNIGTHRSENRKADRVFIEWYEADKKLLYKAAESGEEIGIRVTGRLNDGDILFENSEKVIYIDILPSELICIQADSMRNMGRLCFELGNRHLPLSIDENEVRTPYDEPTFEYLKKLGFKPKKVTEKFLNHTACNSHHHSHES